MLLILTVPVLVGLPGFLVMLGVAGCRGTWILLLLLVEVAVDRCRSFCSVPSPLQSVQRAETWGVIVLLQAAVAFHVGIDHLNVVGHVGMPFELLNDGDL